MLRKMKYKLGFDIWGITLFLLIMVPNFIWFAVPAPNDILRKESITPIIDTIASVFQIIMVAALCGIVQIECKKPMMKQFFVGIVIAILMYFLGWIFYYKGIVNLVIVLDLCIAPCVSFVLFSIARKNVIALISAILFMICHAIYGVMNFKLVS